MHQLCIAPDNTTHPNMLKSSKFFFILICLGHVPLCFSHSYIMFPPYFAVKKLEQSYPLRAMQKYLLCYKSLPADIICTFRWTEIQIKKVSHIFDTYILNNSFQIIWHMHLGVWLHGSLTLVQHYYITYVY